MGVASLCMLFTLFSSVFFLCMPAPPATGEVAGGDNVGAHVQSVPFSLLLAFVACGSSHLVHYLVKRISCRCGAQLSSPQLATRPHFLLILHSTRHPTTPLPPCPFSCCARSSCSCRLQCVRRQLWRRCSDLLNNRQSTRWFIMLVVVYTHRM